jgi:hypothetical protein
VIVSQICAEGLSGPAEAFDLAEKIGRVHDLDVLCVRHALAEVPELPDGALLFLNLSPQTLDADGTDWLLPLVQATELAPHPPVVIEVTERFGAAPMPSSAMTTGDATPRLPYPGRPPCRQVASTSAVSASAVAACPGSGLMSARR